MNWSSIICHFSFVMTDAASDVVVGTNCYADVEKMTNGKWQMITDQIILF